jgi:uncharacterized protein involved in exopolysaccharide biosynthesis
MANEPPRTPILRFARDVLVRRWRLIALALAIPLTGTLAVALFAPRSYRSSAIVVAQRGSDATDDDLDARIGALTSQNLRRSRLFELISRFKPYRDTMRGSTREPLIDQMQKDVAIELDHEERAGRNVVTAIHVTYTAASPRVAADVANELASFYEREDLRTREERAQYTTTKLQEQLADARKQLDAQEARLKDFKMRNLNELPEQVGLHLSELATLSSQMRMARNDPERAQHSDGVRRVPEAPPYDERLDRLAELRTRYTDEYPEVKELKRQIALNPFPRRGAAAASVADVAQPNAEALAAARADNARRASELAEKAAEHEKGILNAPFRQQELDALLPDYIAARNQYQSLWEKYQAAQLWDPHHDGGRLMVLDPAVPRPQAVAPSMRKIAAVGIAAALAIAAGLVLLVERMDNSFHTVEDLRVFTRVPVLATVPQLASSNERRKRARASRAFMAKLFALVLFTFAGSAMLSRPSALIGWIHQLNL